MFYGSNSPICCAHKVQDKQGPQAHPNKQECVAKTFARLVQPLPIC